MGSIAAILRPARARETATCVVARGVHVAIVRVPGTFIHINTSATCWVILESLKSVAMSAVTSESGFAVASVASGYVRTVGVSMTTVQLRTFVNVRTLSAVAKETFLTLATE